jgi:hypothetical protein
LGATLDDGAQAEAEVVDLSLTVYSSMPSIFD